jgi:PAS domain S-box-containing protein
MIFLIYRFQRPIFYMSNQPALKAGYESHLSVIHKSSNSTSLPEMGDPIFQTDLELNLTNWNTTAELLYGKADALGKNIFSLVDVEFLSGSRNELKESLQKNGAWSGEILYKRVDGNNYYFKITATYLFTEANQPQSVLVVCHNTTEAKKKEDQLLSAETKYQILLNTLPEGVMMIAADGKISACNKRGAEIFGLTQEEILGQDAANYSWKAIKQDYSPFPVTEFPAVVSLQTGFPQRNVIIGLEHPYKGLLWLSFNSEALIRPGEFNPYAVVVSYKDVTESRKTEEELRHTNERFYHVTKVTSDAIWDFDMEANTVYRSETFSTLSGHPQENIDGNLNWWFNHVHTDDQERVKQKLNQHIAEGKEKWADEYRFQCADGSYKFLLDSGIILYRNNKAIRILGAICDLTDQKKLEKQLLDEQAQKHQAITLASITAQEREKTNISRELHDNVNQILMSARLYMDTAKKMPEQAEILIDKAIEYQTIALHEIRKLSRTLNTSHIKTVGLKDSVQDIVDNMQLLQRLQVQFEYDEAADNKLTEEQKLMLFRVIQEQSSNITKHAGATSVFIGINYAEGAIQLLMKDNGVGFDTSLKKEGGIGLINIRSRIEAHNGTVAFISSPGNGCRLELSFPVT